MRVLAFVCLLCVLGSAETNLLPRAGSGWSGFKKGSSVRMKLVQIPTGQNARVTIWTTTMKEVGSDFLTLSTVAKNVVGMEQKQETKVPRKGEAGPGEKETIEKLGEEILLVGRKRMKCSRVRRKIRSANGRRIITDWFAADPKVRAKREMTVYDKEGNLTQSVTMLLNSLNERRTVAGKPVRCLRYRYLLRQKIAGRKDMQEIGTVYTSREVPGNDVYMDTKVHQGGRVIMEKRVIALAFEAK